MATALATVQLGRRLRRTMLVTHIVAAGAWIGIDVVVAIMVAVSAFTDDAQTQAVAYRTLGMVAVWPTLIAGLVCLASGVVLGLGTKYGLVRFWWVAIKLCLNIVLSTLVLFALRPGVNELSEFGRATLSGESPAPVNATDMAFPPIVSLTALTIAIVLSVFKPWGRIRKP